MSEITVSTLFAETKTCQFPNFTKKSTGGKITSLFANENRMVNVPDKRKKLGSSSSFI